MHTNKSTLTFKALGTRITWWLDLLPEPSVFKGNVLFFSFSSSTTFFSSCKVDKHQNVNNNFHVSEACLLNFFPFGFKLHKVFSIILKFEKNLCASEKTKPCIKRKPQLSKIDNPHKPSTLPNKEVSGLCTHCERWPCWTTTKNQSTDVNSKNVQWSVHGDMQIYVALLSLLQTQIHRHTDIHTLRSMFSCISTNTQTYTRCAVCLVVYPLTHR